MSKLTQADLRLMLQRFLVASYCYYQLDESIIPDETYDFMAKTLLNHWEEFDHQHKYLITKGDLEAGTLFALTQYPERIKNAARQHLSERTSKAH